MTTTAIRRVSRQHPCPICGKGDWCNHLGEWGAHCMRVEAGSHKPANGESGGWIHLLDGHEHDWQERLAAMPTPTPSRRTVDPDLADRTYRALLARLTLNTDHQDDLRARGHTDDAIVRNTYATSPATKQERQALAAKVAEELGCELAGQVPGFIRRGGTLDLACEPGELLIPVRDVQGRIVGIRRRIDHAHDGKYRWMSWGDGPDSISVDGHTVHVARPEHLTSARYVVLTEGEIKANIIADRLGCLVISVPGVANLGQVVETLQALGDVEYIAIAYDADSAVNEAVATHEQRAGTMLVKAGYQVCRWVWELDAGKGLDDLLHAGRMPFALPWSAPAPPTGPGTPPDSTGDVAEELEQLRRLHAVERQATAMNQARARIQRNTKLPARPMAATVLGVFAQATKASNPAGGHRVPAGFVLAPVGTLAFDAGTKTGNAGTQLKKLEEAGLIARHTVPDTLSPGNVDPETGQTFTTPRRVERHFIAVAGHEHEPITPEIWSELVERMAAYDSGTPERRGGFRIPRCPHHPHAKVERRWTAHCTACGEQLYPDLGEVAVDEIPAMLLEPIATVHQTLVDRAEAVSAVHQSLIDREDDITDTNFNTVITTPPGNRSIAYKVHDTVESAAVHQSLVDRKPHAMTPEEARKARLRDSMAEWQDTHVPVAPPPREVQESFVLAADFGTAGYDQYTEL